MKIVERQVGDVIILDIQGKILIGEGDDALREAVTRLSGGKRKILEPGCVRSRFAASADVRAQTVTSRARSS